MAKVRHFDEDFLLRFTPVLNMIGHEVVAERAESSWLVDSDLVEVLKALTATMKTLSSGIYYESIPDGSIRQSLFRRLKRVIDHAMAPEQELLERSLRTSEAIEVLEFLTVSVQAKSSNRPKSRDYLDWLASMLGISPVEESRSGLILP